MPYQGQARWRRTGWLLRQWACLAFMLLAGTIHAADATWKAGVAKAVITPGQPLWMAGYGGRTAPAEGKYHDLWVRALALEAADGHRSVILSSDILGISQPIYRDVTAKLKERFQLEPSQVMLHASHTHCGPVLRRALPDIYPLDDEQRQRIEEYSDRLTATIVDTIGEALEDLQPASLSSGIGSAGFAVNRRTNREPDVPMLRSQNLLLGPVDHSVPVLAVRRGEALTAVVFGYACHNTTLAFQKWCGDYAGFAQDELEAKHPGLTAMFALGCGADQNPLPRRTVELAKDYGHQLSLAVEQVLAGQMTEIRPTLRTELQMTDLSYGPMPPQDRLEQMAATGSGYLKRWANRMLSLQTQGQELPKAYPYPVQVWKMGDHLLWISLGGEVVVDYSLRLKAEYGWDTWVSGYVNDVMAYIPSERVLAEGGYEGQSSMYVYGHPAEKWASGIEARIVGVIDELAQRLQSGDKNAATR